MSVFKVDRASLGLLGDDNWLSVISLFDLAGMHELQFMADDSIGLPQERLSRYVHYIHSRYISTYLRLQSETPPPISLRQVFQGEDCSRDVRSIGWESQKGWTNIVLIPDMYYFLERGHEHFLPEGSPIRPWSDRRPTIVWRGSTTGVIAGADLYAMGFGADTLDLLPRYRMCRLLQQLGDGADVGIVAIVQCLAGDEPAVSARLAAEGLATGYVPAVDMANYKYLVDIDGNTNSWNLVQRLRLGCCILKVESPWNQWISHRIRPWVHYVPIKADLSDLLEKVDWCLTHDREAEQIARNSRTFGLSVRFETEMQQAALDILRTSVPLSGQPEDQEALQRACAAADQLRPAWNAAIAAWPSFPKPMWLETFHGTVLGKDGSGAVVQLSGDGDPTSAITLFGGDRDWPEALRGFHMNRDGDSVSLERGGLFLSAEPGQATMACDRTSRGEWESFRLIPAR